MTTVRRLAELDGQPHANVFREAEPKTIRLRLAEDEQIPAHAHPDRQVVLYLVEGSVELRLDDESHELSAGDVARFDGDRQISPRAREPSTVLVVLAARADD